jgi:hypothetical protein
MQMFSAGIDMNRRGSQIRRINWCIALAALCCGAVARAEVSREYQVKAAFLFNFAQFVQWPDAAMTADEPLIIATVGTDPFEGMLDKAVAGKTIGKHRIEVHHAGSAQDIGKCHLLFVPAGQNAGEIISAVGNKAVLMVGESDNFTDAGGDIRFFLEDGKIRFEIDPDSTSRGGLKVSSKLLNLARIHKR